MNYHISALLRNIIKFMYHITMKVFDSVNLTIINIIAVKALRKQGVEKIYVKVLCDIYNESTATIKLHKVSEKILRKKGGLTRRHYFSYYFHCGDK